MTLSIEGSDGFVASSAASIATGQATLPRQDFHLLEYTRIHGARSGVFVAVEPAFWEIKDSRPLYSSPVTNTSPSTLLCSSHLSNKYSRPLYSFLDFHTNDNASPTKTPDPFFASFSLPSACATNENPLNNTIRPGSSRAERYCRCSRHNNDLLAGGRVPKQRLPTRLFFPLAGGIVGGVKRCYNAVLSPMAQIP